MATAAWFSHRTLPILGVVLVLTVAWLVGWLRPAESALRDLRFNAATRPASGDVIFVDIDEASIASAGKWPWSRALHARLLDTLLNWGANEIVFDVDFSTAADPIGDAAFEASLRNAGGYAFLAAFQQPQGQQAYNLPLPRFASNAAPVAVNVTLDPGGVVRSYPYSVVLGSNPVSSVASVLAHHEARDGAMTIDFSIDPRTLVRVAAKDVLDGTAPAGAFAGKQVVIGASAVELKDFFMVPRYGMLPGAVLQIMATETLKQGRGASELGPWPALALLALLAAGILIARPRLPRVVLLALGVLLTAEVAATLAQIHFALLLDTAALDAGLAGLVLFALIEEVVRRGRERQIAQARLRYLAEHDVLTGVLSRASLVDRIGARLAGGGQVTVIALDIRRFRAVNDTLGHELGDELLRLVARRLTELYPEAMARLGADSFAVLLPAATARGVTAFCEAAIASIAIPFDLDGGQQVTVAVSIGVASLEHGSSETAETLLRQADMALSLAKQRTGSQVAAFTPDMDAALRGRQQLHSALHKAVDAQQFTLAYQPQIDLATGTVVGAEALARWHHVELGVVSPLNFIAAAEETGLIVDLGRWALLEACREAAGWPISQRIAVNLSPVQFELSDVVSEVANALAQSGLQADRLDLEITESVFLGGGAETIQTLEAIRAMGVRIALDDFGTGYSSLSYLGRLPVDKIKIDQSFVRRLPADAEAVAIAQAIMSLSRALNKLVVAEGIETPEQRDLLRDLGCQIGQGYLFGRPMTATQLQNMTDAGVAVRPASQHAKLFAQAR